MKFHVSTFCQIASCFQLIDDAESSGQLNCQFIIQAFQFLQEKFEQLGSLYQEMKKDYEALDRDMKQLEDYIPEGILSPSNNVSAEETKIIQDHQNHYKVLKEQLVCSLLSL